MEEIFEKRRTKRLPVSLHLNVSDLFKQDNSFITDINAPIHVTNISKGGIGFTCAAVLPTGYYFNAEINLGNPESTLYAVVRIMRCDENGDEYKYGCEFIGLSPVLDFIFNDFDGPDKESNTPQ